VLWVSACVYVWQVAKAKFNDDPYLQAFGITVASHMVDVQGRILPVPKLQYGGRVWQLACYFAEASLRVYLAFCTFNSNRILIDYGAL